MTIQEREKQLVHKFQKMDDWTFQYEYLFIQAANLPQLDPAFRSEEYLLSGCQSKVWIRTIQEGEVFRFEGDSPSLIVKGLLALLIDLLSGRSAEEICHFHICFLDQTALGKQLSVDRQFGVRAMLDFMKKKVSTSLSDLRTDTDIAADKNVHQHFSDQY